VDGRSGLSITTPFSCPELQFDPVPMRMIISNNDKTLAAIFNATTAQVDARLRGIAKEYAAANGIAAAPQGTWTWRTGWGVLTETQRWSNGDPRRETVLDVFDTGGSQNDGHVWPGSWFGGEYQTTNVIWNFFVTHPRTW
jgi:hypothetical protein